MLIDERDNYYFYYLDKTIVLFGTRAVYLFLIPLTKHPSNCFFFSNNLKLAEQQEDGKIRQTSNSACFRLQIEKNAEGRRKRAKKEEEEEEAKKSSRSGPPEVCVPRIVSVMRWESLKKHQNFHRRSCAPTSSLNISQKKNELKG